MSAINLEKSSRLYFKDLCESCTYGNLNYVKHLLSIKHFKGYDNDYYYNTALRLAIKYKYHEIAKELINLNIDVNQMVGVQSHMYFACDNGDIKMVKMLIEAGAKFEPTEPLLHLVFKSKNNDIFDLLLESGIDVNQKDVGGNTCLCNTVCCNNVHFTKKLLEYGADVNIHDRDGRTLLYISCYNGYHEIFDILISNGADINKKNIQDGRTPLFGAVWANEYNIIEKIINLGANIDEIDKNGFTYLILAIKTLNHRRVKLLLSFGANIDIYDIYGMSTIQHAFHSEDEKIINIILKTYWGINDKSRKIKKQRKE